jgi:hypothetical protein
MPGGPRLLSANMLSLLAMAAIGLGAASASGATRTTRPGAPQPPAGADGTTMASAIPLTANATYAGKLVRHSELAWYKLAGEASPLGVDVQSTTSSCAVRASILNSGGRVFGELISSAREDLPFVVGVPVVGVYYLRLDVNPYSHYPCAGAGYLIREVRLHPLEASSPNEGTEPNEPTPGSSPGREAPRHKRRKAPARLESQACVHWASILSHVTREVARARSRVFGGHGGLGLLRSLERSRRHYKRVVLYYCGGL